MWNQTEKADYNAFSEISKKRGSIDNHIYSSVFPRGSQPARFYGLPKLHKHRENYNAPPIRPILSSSNSYNFNLSKYLCTLLNPVTPNNYTTSNSFTFVNELHTQNHNNNYFVSFDVQILFTNIPLSETIDIALDLIYSHHPNLKK